MAPPFLLFIQEKREDGSTSKYVTEVQDNATQLLIIAKCILLEQELLLDQFLGMHNTR